MSSKILVCAVIAIGTLTASLSYAREVEIPLELSIGTSSTPGAGCISVTESPFQELSKIKIETDGDWFEQGSTEIKDTVNGEDVFARLDLWNPRLDLPNLWPTLTVTLTFRKNEFRAVYWSKDRGSIRIQRTQTDFGCIPLEDGRFLQVGVVIGQLD